MHSVDRYDDSESLRYIEEEPLLSNRSEAKGFKLASFIWRVRRKHKVKGSSGKSDRSRHRRSWSRIRRWHVGARRRLRCWFYVQQHWVKNCASHWMAQFRRGMFHNRNSVLDRVFFSRRKRQRHFAARASKSVPKGFVPVYVGQEHQRFVIPVMYLHHPLFEGFLKAAEQEFGYDQNGGLLIPCDVTDFEETTLQMKDCQLLRRSSSALSK